MLDLDQPEGRADKRGNVAITIPDILSPVVSQLTLAAQQGRIAWREGPGRHEMLVVFPRASIRLYQYMDATRQEPGFALEVLDDNGEVVERCNAPIGTPAARRLRHLHRIALRQTRRGEQVIEQVMQELTQEGMIGLADEPGPSEPRPEPVEPWHFR